MRTISTVLFLALQAGILFAAAKAVELKTVALGPLDCQMQIPAGWSVYDQSKQGCGSWVITLDDLSKAHYTTGVSIDALAHVESQTGLKPSRWVAARITDKSSSLPVLSSEAGPTNAYFRVMRLVTEEVYSPGRTEYTTYRKIYSWYWNDQQDVVVCLETRTPAKSWTSMSAVLDTICKLEFDVAAWKKKLTPIKE